MTIVIIALWTFVYGILLFKTLETEITVLKSKIEGYSEDETTKAAKRNIKRLVRLNGCTDKRIEERIDRIKVLYRKGLDSKGKHIRSIFCNVILVNADIREEVLRQGTIEHELLHEVDFRIGITGAWKSIGERKHKTKGMLNLMTRDERKKWLVEKFDFNPEVISDYVVHTEAERTYWLSDEELFVTLNTLRLFMFKKKILVSKNDRIGRVHVDRLVETIAADEHNAAYDFFNMLSFVRTETDQDLERLNKGIETLNKTMRWKQERHY